MPVRPEIRRRATPNASLERQVETLQQDRDDHEYRVRQLEALVPGQDVPVNSDVSTWFVQSNIYGPGLVTHCLKFGGNWTLQTGGGCPSGFYLECTANNDAFYIPILVGDNIGSDWNIGQTNDGGRGKYGYAQDDGGGDPTALIYTEVADPAYNFDWSSGGAGDLWGTSPSHIGSIGVNSALEAGDPGGPDLYWIRVRMTTLGPDGTRGRIWGSYHYTIEAILPDPH